MLFQVATDQIEQVLLYVRQEAQRLNIPVKLIHKMELACEEAIVNIFSYAHPNPTNSISLECHLDGPDRFEVVIKDRGPEFNPLEVEIDPQKDKPVLERRIGGLGIYLIRKLVDEAVYKREGDTNILRLILAID